MRPQYRQYRFIDMLKGLGMSIVMADHSGFYLCPVLDYFEVPVFFLASGFLFVPCAFSAFIHKKSNRLLVPYIVYSILFLILCYPFGLEISSAKQLAMMLLAPANYPLWFLKALFWALLIFWGLWRVGAFSNHLRWSLTLIVAMVLGVVVCHVSIGRTLILMTGLPQSVAALPLMIVGHGLRRWVDTDRSILLVSKTNSVSSKIFKYSIVALLLVAAILFIHGHLGFSVCNIGAQPLLFYPMAFLSCGAFVALFMAIPLIAPLEFVGKQSLQYFCLHAIPIYILRSFGIISSWAVFLAACVITTAIILIYKYINHCYL